MVEDLRTTRLMSLSINHLRPDSLAIIAGGSTEERGRLSEWDRLKVADAGRVLEVVSEADEYIEVALPAGREQVSLRDHRRLQALLAGHDCVYLDISGLSHHVWAPLLRAALSAAERIFALYAEPHSYRRHPNPSSPMLYDLSTEFRDVGPIPGLARLSGPAPDRSTVLVAFLGFEGMRPMKLGLQMDDTPTATVAVVGVPGFRPEYPGVAVASNAEFLASFDAFHRLRYARASCPFEAYALLEETSKDHSTPYMYIAPVGTKPHALGAVLFALVHQEDVEIIYDHPIRRPKRTEGVGTVHMYDLSEFRGAGS